MARLLGEARVSVLPDGTRFKPEAEAAVKKAAAGISANIALAAQSDRFKAEAEAAAKEVSKGVSATVQIKGDAKDLDAQMAELAAKSEALKKSLGNIKVSDPNMQAFLKGITKQADELRNSLDGIGNSDGAAKAAASLDRMVTASDKVRAALGKTTFAEEQIAAAAKDTASKVEDSASRQTAAVKRFADEVSKDAALKDGVVIKVKLDETLSDSQLVDLRIKLDRLNTDIRIGLNDKDAEVEALTLREKLSLLLSDIKAKVHLDSNSTSGILSFIGGKFSSDLKKKFEAAGNGSGSGFVSGLAKSAIFQNPGITAAVIAGLAALPAAVGVVGVLGGIALGAGIIYGANKLVTAQLKTLTTDIKNNTTILNAKSTSPAAAQAAKEAIASDQAQVAALNKQVQAFQGIKTAVGNLKVAFTQFAVVASKPLIKPFTDALNLLSAQLKGPLASAFASLFKAVGPLVKPVEEALLEIVNGALPGLTSMLTKARAPLSALFLGFGKIVGIKLGDWFRAATPYIAASGKYFLELVSALGSVVTWLIKFGGESAKAFGGSQFKGFGALIQSIANSLLKIVIPAFEGWTAVMAPVIKELLQILDPLLKFLAANPGLVKAIGAVIAGYILLSKATLILVGVTKLLGLSMDAIPWVALAAAVVIAAVLIVQHWGAISSFFVKVWKDIWANSLGPMINFFTNTIPHAFSVSVNSSKPITNFFSNTIPHAFGVTLDWLKKNWVLIVGIIATPFGGAGILVAKYHQQIFNVVKAGWLKIADVIAVVTKPIASVISGIFKPIASVVVGVWNEIYKATRDTWGVIYKIIEIPVLIIVGLIGEAWRGIKNLTGLVWPSVYNIIKETWGHIENATTGVVKPMVSWIEGAWAVLKSVTKGAYDWIFNDIKTTWGRTENATTGIVKPMVSWVEGAWAVLKSVTKGAYDWLFNTIKDAWGHIENITTGIVKPMVNWVESAWATLKAATLAAYNWIYNTIKDAWGHIENVTTGIVKPMVNWVESAWAVLKSATSNAFIWIYNAIINPLQKAYNWVVHNFVTGIKSAFSGLISAVKSIWNGLKSAVGTPINFVIGIWNKFAGFVDKGLSIFGIKTKLPMGTPIKFAKGGHVPGFAPGVDNVPAMLSPGEFVLTPEAVQAIGVGNLHSLNKNTRTGGKNGGRGAFANGGDVVNDIEKWNGHKYVWGGGANPSTGWDCSSFVNYIVGHDFKLNLPGGGSWASMTNNGAAHGPVAASYNNWNYGRGVPWSTAKMGDLAIENNGAHIGFIIENNSTGSSSATLQGFAARSTATGTGYEQFFPSAFHLERFADDRGFLTQVWDNTGGAVLKAAASVALNGIESLVNGAMNHIPGSGPIPQLAKVTVDDVINAAKSKLTGNQNNYQFNNPAATGPAGTGTSAGEMANGKQLYNYLLKYLFGGNKIAAAGAAASIWGESMWNPFAQGTGGRGLIGWTPPSTISDAAFSGGMATQLPAILQFVTSSGDSGVIAEMFRASSVTQAANEWGKGVERYGINDVHTEGISLATSFMKNGGLVPTHVFDRGGTLAPGVNTVYNLTGKPEHLTPTNGGGNSQVTLEVAGGGESEFEQFMLLAIRKWVRIKGGRGDGSVQRAFGRN